MTTYQQDKLIIFLETPLNRINDSVNHFLDLADKRLNKLLPGLVISWGIGENHAGVKTFHDSFDEARIALDLGRRQKGAGHRSTYANTGIYRVLLTLANNPDMQEIIQSTIGTLVDYDRKRKLDLLQTLSLYILN